MASKSTTVKLGLFIFLGITIIVITIFLLGDKNQLFKSTFTVKAYFRDIQGLRSGAMVRLSGIDVGSVKSLNIVSDTTGRVEVTMKLVEDIHQFIKTDSHASIETEGLVGNKVVVLSVGSANAETITDQGTIIAREPIGFGAIIVETQGIMQYTKQMTKDLAEIVQRVNNGEGSIGKLLKDDKLYNDATNLTRTADQSLKSITDQLSQVSGLFTELGVGVRRVVTNIDSITSNIDNIISGIKDGKGLLGALVVDGTKYDSTFKSVMSNIDKTSGDARLAASRLAENMEALKHNWLFKSYFEQRGYWDKAEYENTLDSQMKELNNKIKMLDERIEKLKSLETSRK